MNTKRIFKISGLSGYRFSGIAKRVKRSLQSSIVASVVVFALVCTVPHVASAQSISVAELADQLVSDQKAPIIIDVRLSARYTAGHIPNAISIPLPSLNSRRLPPLGDVIVYDDGMGRGNIEEAVVLLNRKPGIKAVSLKGGYAAWETRSGVTTSSKGLAPERKPVITYEDLVATQGEGIVVYDLRQPASASSGGARLASLGEGAESKDLRDLLPMARQENGSPLTLLKPDRKVPSGGARLMASEDEVNPLIRGSVLPTDELIVLIDDDHQTAEETARRLRAGGFERVAVLAGGDLILKFEGRSGLERQGTGGALESATMKGDAE